MTWLKCYKGFNKNMQCRGYQFEEGKEYSIPDGEEAKLCENGFHACEAPIDCLNYYEPAHSVYHEVALDATEEKQDEDSKRVGKRIRIGAKISIGSMVKAQFEYVKEHAVNKGNGHSTGPRSANSATGDWSANSATGYGSANITTGNECKNEGYEGTINVGWGKDNKCKGKIGAYLVLCERGDWDGNKYPMIGEPVLVKVDGEMVKADTWYMLKNGEIVEEENE